MGKGHSLQISPISRCSAGGKHGVPPVLLILQERCGQGQALKLLPFPIPLFHCPKMAWIEFEAADSERQLRCLLRQKTSIWPLRRGEDRRFVTRRFFRTRGQYRVGDQEFPSPSRFSARVVRSLASLVFWSGLDLKSFVRTHLIPILVHHAPLTERTQAVREWNALAKRSVFDSLLYL